jgi:hypothetical protein
VPALWNVPKTSQVEYQPIKIMDFGRIISSHKLSHQLPAVNAYEMVEMLRNIEEASSSSVLMRVLEPFASEMETVEEVPYMFKNLYNNDFEQLGLEKLQHASQCSL